MRRGPANAEVTPIVERRTATPGSIVRAALQVRLPEGYHTNSNKPRDPARWGEVAFYGWSEDKARQYGVPQRADFGAFVRRKGFGLD